MVEHEVVWSRKRELDEFGTGLDMLGLQTILRQNPEVCSSLLCHSDSSFGPEQFEECLNRATDPDDFVQSQAYGWFNTYIGENPKSEFYQGGCRLKALLHFSTGFQVPPPPWSKSSKDHNVFFTWWWWSSVSHSPSLFWLSKAANCSLFKECI